MVKGLMIMLVVFLVIGIIGWVMQMFSKVSEEKKKKYRKNLLIFYGFFLIIQGSVTFNESDEFDFLAILQLLMGIIIIGAVTLGKHEQNFNLKS
ncbi:MAG: DUF3149 domain-containing protein [Muriicola sp.]|nr:DUF3149 domain-containing protein [Muriicola sp.]